MDEIIEWLLRLIDFDTTSEGPDAERCVRYIARILAERGALVHAYTTEGALRRGHHLLAEVPGERAETLLLHAHLDTADWTRRTAAGSRTGSFHPAGHPGAAAAYAGAERLTARDRWPYG